jgi:peptidoglycan/LPS O-acetylase OafA/YrhL
MFTPDTNLVKTNIPVRLFWLDIIRGIAALSVVLWHWQHFFYNGTLAHISMGGVDKTQYPLYAILWPFYEHGSLAVELFFTLSGFIFFWLYGQRISNKKVSFKNYMALRLSRLYPLHLLTLFLVIIGQAYIHYLRGWYFVYDDYSLGAFLANITLTHRWFSSNYTFNGPVWSVSIELLLYIIFYALCFIKLEKWWQVAIIIAIGWGLRNTRFDSVGQGIISFFSGGIAYYLFSWLMQHAGKKKRLLFLAILPIIVIGAIMLYYKAGIAIPSYFYGMVLFPVSITTIALLEATIGAGPAKHFVFIGNISYSSYLLHFPLQLALVISGQLLAWNQMIFQSPLMLGAFYITLIIISLVSYHQFEMPAQKYLRGKWIPAKPLPLINSPA